ncbi:MAG: polysaccharide biosynthesis tyrosine autokinase [Cryobacterium sp.]|nr:polysaccharide biosynthesis tyrosine autokinase [Cryobacterium sp.]
MELRDYLRILRAHWWVIILATLAGLAIAFGWTLLQPKIYQADVTGIVQMKTGGTSVGEETVAQNLALSKVTSYIQYGTSRAVAQRTIDKLGLKTTPESLVGRISVTNPAETPIIKVTASSSDPEGARDLATAWLSEMVAQIKEVETTTKTVETTDADGNTVETVQTVEPLLNLVPIDSAILPDSPSSPNVRLALLIGGLLGLALGVGYALLKHQLDRRVRSAEVVERETGVAVVGAVPANRGFEGDSRIIPVGVSRSEERDKHVTEGRSTAEALRELRTNLQFMDVDNPPRIIVVTSPVPGDGKSTIAANLAVTVALSGQKVVLIDGDLRRPMISTIFNLPTGGGLSDVLAGRAVIGDVLHTWSGASNLQIVTAGRTPPNPSEVLGSERMNQLIHWFAENSLVIIDAPPLLAVTDATILANRADGALVVTSVGSTTYELLEKALGTLKRANARAMGIILNRIPKRGVDSAYYGYRGYYNQDDPRYSKARKRAGEKRSRREQIEV